MLGSVTSWLLTRDNPILVGLRVTVLVAVWGRVLVARKDSPPWAYLGVLLYLAVGISWAVGYGLLVTFGIVDPPSSPLIVAPSLYLLYSCVIVWFLTDRRRVLARRAAINRALARAEELLAHAQER